MFLRLGNVRLVNVRRRMSCCRRFQCKQQRPRRRPFVDLLFIPAMWWHSTKKNIHKFIRMNPKGHQSTPSNRLPANGLPGSYSWEVFTVVDAGKGEIALYNTIHGRFMRMNKNGKVDSSPPVPIQKLHSAWNWERFRPVYAGHGRWALHSKAHNRFVKMDDRAIWGSPHKAFNQLPSGWKLEKFNVVVIARPTPGYIMTAGWNCPHKIVGRHTRLTERRCAQKCDSNKRCTSFNWLKGVCWLSSHNWPCGAASGGFVFYWNIRRTILLSGNVVAFHSAFHNRFMRMYQHGMDRSSPHGINGIPRGWTWERFTVVDVGHGLIALFCKIHGRFVELKGATLGKAAPVSIANLKSSMKFRAVDALNGQIALWSPAWRRFITMSHKRPFMISQVRRNENDLPTDWRAERFNVAVLHQATYKPPTPKPRPTTPRGPVASDFVKRPHCSHAKYITASQCAVACRVMGYKGHACSWEGAECLIWDDMMAICHK